MTMKRFLMAFGALLAGCLSAATLNVDLTVTHGVYSKDEASQGKRVVFLVLDRSASMGFKTLKGGRTPNEALIESLKLQLAAIPLGTEVRVVPFSSAIWDLQVYKGFDDHARKAILDFVTEKEPKGLTVLYDAQDLVFGEAVKILDGDANAEVRVLVYTDGEHQTPWDYEGEYKACYQNAVKKLGRKRFEDNPNYRNDLETARQKFKSRFKGLVSRLNLEVEYEWLSETDKPEPEMVTKSSLPTELSTQTTDLANPLERPDQTIGVGLRLPISDKCWEEVKGKPVSLVFEVGGKYVEDRFTLDQGRHNVKLTWPSLPTDSSETARLVLARLPGGAKFVLKEPKPLFWRVPAQGRVSVEVTAPVKDAVVAAGTEVKFVAKASDQADVAWTFGGSLKTLKGSSVCWKPESAGIIQYCATATKTGFKESSATGRLEVIPTGVEVASPDGRHAVGKKSVFQAKAIGPCQRYAWTVDGRRVPGEKASLEHVFEESGSHQVGVTAFYKNNLQAVSEPKAVVVAKAPLVKILAPAPYDGDVENATFQAERPIDLSARVEGDLTEVVWQFKLKDKVIASFPTTVKDGNVVGRYTPPKGGYYDVIATGKGLAGEKSATVQVFVKSAEVRVDITSPKSNQDVETGKAFALDAVVKGPVKSVRWKVVDRSTAKPASFGQADVSAVVEGKTSITAKLPPELGNASVSVEAEPVLEDADLAETVAPSVIIIGAKTPADIAYTPETLGLNWKKVKYGEQVKLAVTTSGAIKKVAWFSSDASGKEVALGKEGPAVNVDIAAVRGQNERHVDYFAKGLMPDGSWLPAEERITIVGYCDCGDCSIRLPKGTDGQTRRRFRLGETFSVELEVAEGKKKPGSVAWDFGDGKCGSGLSTEHAYGRDDSNLVIRVEARCAVCGKLFSDSEMVSCGVIPPKAYFEIKNYKGSVTCGSTIELDASKTEGDAVDYVWTADGKELAEYRGKPKAFLPCGRRPCNRVIRLDVTAPVGYKADVPSCSQEVRIRFGWWAVGLFLLISAVLIAIFYYFFGRRNGPAGWRIYYLEKGEPKPDRKGSFASESDYDRYAGSISLYRYWNVVHHYGRIPIEAVSEFLCVSVPGAEFTLEEGVDNPDFEGPAGLENVTKYFKVKPQDGHWYCFRLRKDTAKVPKYLRLIVRTKPADVRYRILFWALTLLVLAVCFVACRQYAI